MTGYRLTSSIPAMMRSLGSCFDATRMWRRTERANLESARALPPPRAFAWRSFPFNKKRHRDIRQMAFRTRHQQIDGVVRIRDASDFASIQRFSGYLGGRAVLGSPASTNRIAARGPMTLK